MKHTPKPWSWRREGPTVIIEPIKATITVLSGPDGFREEQDADARLLAAAPDLLEACKQAEECIDELVRYLAKYAPPVEAPCTSYVGENHFLDIIRTAIQKAEGDTQ